MFNLTTTKKGFVSLLGLLLALGIIFFIGYSLYGIYLKSNETSPMKKSESIQIYGPPLGDGTFQGAKEKIQDIKRSIFGKGESIF